MKCPHQSPSGQHVRCGLMPSVSLMSVRICEACQTEWPGNLPPTLATLPESARSLSPPVAPKPEPIPERRRPCIYLGEPADSRPCCGGRSYACAFHKKNVTVATCKGCGDYEAIP
jgi:hypothetical protein